MWLLAVPRVAVATVQLAVALGLLLNAFLLLRIDSRLTNGWAIADAEEIQVIYTIARQLIMFGLLFTSFAPRLDNAVVVAG